MPEKTKQEEAQALAVAQAKTTIEALELAAGEDRTLETLALQLVAQALGERAQILSQREAQDREAFLAANEAAYRTHRAAKEVERKVVAGARAAIEK